MDGHTPRHARCASPILWLTIAVLAATTIDARCLKETARVPGGTTVTASTVGDLVLFGSGLHLVIARVENGTGSTTLSSTRLPGAPREIVTSHGIAYIACERRGMAVVDFSNPRAPNQIGFVHTGDAMGLSLQESMVVVAAGSEGLAAFDVSDPRQPHRLWIDPTSGAWDIITHRRISYVIRDDGVIAADLTGSGGPVILSHFLGERRPSALGAAGKHLFVTGFDRGLDVIDISHPESPVLVGQADGSWSSGWDIRVERGMASISNGDLHLLNVKDPANPSFLAALDTPGEALSSVFRGSTILVSDSSSGITVIDASNPSGPLMVDRWHPGIQATVVAREGNLAIFAEPGKLHVLDLSNPLLPVSAGVFDRSEAVEDVVVEGSLAFVADRDFGLRIIDLEDPNRPVQIGVYAVDMAMAVAVSGPICALTDSQDLVVLDVSKPSRPVLLGRIDLGMTGRDIEIADDTAFLACHEDGIVAVDLSDPNSPDPIGWFSVDQIGVGYAAGIEVTGDVAYVAFRLGGLRVLDISDPARMNEIGQPQNFTINALDVDVDGSLAFVSDWHHGLWVFDLETPENPVMLELLEDPGRITNAAADRGSVVLAAGNGGLPVFDTEPCRLGEQPLPMEWSPAEPITGQPVRFPPRELEPVRFAPLKIEAEGWEWVFSDGVVMTGMLPGRTFRVEGSTTVSLIVTRDLSTETYTGTIDVTRAKPRSTGGRRITPSP